MSNTRDACAEIRWVRRCLRSSLSHQTPVAVTSSGHAGRSEDKGLPASRHATSAFASHRLHSCDPKIHLLHLSSSFRMVVRTSSVIGLYHGDMKKKNETSERCGVEVVGDPSADAKLAWFHMDS